MAKKTTKLYNPVKDAWIKLDPEHAERVLDFQEKSGSKTRLLREKPGTTTEPATDNGPEEG